MEKISWSKEWSPEEWGEIDVFTVKIKVIPKVDDKASKRLARGFEKFLNNHISNYILPAVEKTLNATDRKLGLK